MANTYKYANFALGELANDCPPQQIAKMQAQARHVAAMQKRAQGPLFPYQKLNAIRLLHPLPHVARPKPQMLTILDEVGNLAFPVQHAQAAAWQQELAAHPAPERAARLHVWLGEWQLAHDEQPAAAFAQFQAAQRLTKRTDPVYGLAAYDRAITFFQEGAYGDAETAFAHLLAHAPRLHGFDRGDCVLWQRHAGACAGYHADRAKAGIPEPPRLDPLCAAAGLASSLRALRLPSDKRTVLGKMRVTGEGSFITDILAAAPKLGATARMVRADDKGLMLLPKPLVAFVEHDHFVSVVRADNKGVSYLCSDCGAWPGGEVDLSWRQWHMLDGGLYVAVTRPGSMDDRLVTGLNVSDSLPAPHAASAPTAPAIAAPAVPGPAFASLSAALTPAPVRVAEATSPIELPGLSLSQHPLLPLPGLLADPAPVDAAFLVHLSALRAHAVLTTYSGTGACGAKPGSPECRKCLQCCHKQGAGPGGSPAPGGGNGKGGSTAKLLAMGASQGDPVNVATGEEEYTPEADITVYNPHGPSVSWSRLYNSLRRPGQGLVEPKAMAAGKPSASLTMR